jgi:iron complex transport system substrate-binding protein
MTSGLLRGLKRLAWGLAAMVSIAAHAEVSVLDDDGQRVTLPAPARRIVSLAPHTTELLFAAGAGSQVVATVRYGDYPPAAKQLPVVGDSHSLDLERILALKPDLIVVWMHGSSERQIERLRALNLPLFHSEPRTLEGVASNLQRLGLLAGTVPAANAAAAQFNSTLASLRTTYAHKTPVRVFYQVWNQPLMTINDHQLISDALRTCGAVNVYGDATALVPTITTESVLERRPQALVTATPSGQPDESLRMWADFPRFEPVARHHIIVLPSDLMSRQGPRVIEGTRRLCEALDGVRNDLARQPSAGAPR